jgi:prepilin-type N-terminal cleavage/methylation domain-containing protein
MFLAVAAVEEEGPMVRGRQGFSIIELLVVIGILGVMMAIVIPFYVGYRPRLMLSQSGGKVLSALRMARQRAVSEARPHTVHFDWSGEAYKTDNGPWMPLGIQTDMSQGTGFTEDSLIFDPDGKASAGGTIVFSSSRIPERYELYISVAGFTKLQQVR